MMNYRTARNLGNALIVAGGLIITGATAAGAYETFRGKLNMDALFAAYSLGAAPISVGYGILKDIENQNI